MNNPYDPGASSEPNNQNYGGDLPPLACSCGRVSKPPTPDATCPACGEAYALRAAQHCPACGHVESGGPAQESCPDCGERLPAQQLEWDHVPQRGICPICGSQLEKAMPGLYRCPTCRLERRYKLDAKEWTNVPVPLRCFCNKEFVPDGGEICCPACHTNYSFNKGSRKWEAVSSPEPAGGVPSASGPSAMPPALPPDGFPVAGGPAGTQEPPFPKPDSYLVWSILVTLFCCLPGGIYSIVKSSQVNSLWTSGRHQEALEASRAANRCNWVCAVAFVIFYVIIAIAGN